MLRYTSGAIRREGGVVEKIISSNYQRIHQLVHFTNPTQSSTTRSKTSTSLPNIKRFKSRKNLKKSNPFRAAKKYCNISSGLSFLSSNQFKLNHSSKLTEKPLEFLFSDQFKSYYSTSSNIMQLYLKDLDPAQFKVNTPSINANTITTAPSNSSLVGYLVSKFKYAYSRSDELLAHFFNKLYPINNIHINYL